MKRHGKTSNLECRMTQARKPLKRFFLSPPPAHTQLKQGVNESEFTAQSSANKYSKSVFDKLRAKPSSPSTSAMVCALRCCSSQIFSSTVPGEISRYAFTVCVWPIRCDRSIACASTAGFHHGS